MALYGSGTAGKYWRSPALRGLAGGGRPFWVSCWTKAPTVPGATNSGLAHFGSSTGGSASAGAYIDTNTPGFIYAWDQDDAATFFQASTNAFGTVAGVWQHVLCVYPDVNTRSVYLNGALVGANPTLTGSLGAQTFDCFTVGRITTNAMPSNRLIGEVVFGRGTPNPQQVAGLAGGSMNPLRLVPPGQMLAYFPLQFDLADDGPLHLNLMPLAGAQAIFGEHPRVPGPPRRKLYAAAGASRALTPNAATAAGSQAGTLTRSRALSGAATASGTSAASLTATHALVAAATATSTQAAALGRLRALAGAATASTSQNASIGRARALTPNAATAASSQAASDAAVRRMIAAAVAASSQSGSVTRGRALAGSTTALTTQAASIAKFTQGQLAGQGLAAGSAAAALHAIRALAGAATAGGAAAGSIARSRGLAGTGAAATSTQAAILRRSRLLTPAAGGTAVSGQAGVLVALHALHATGSASASAQATLGRTRPLVGAASASSSQTARLTAGDLPAPAVVYNIVRFERDVRVVRFARDLRTVRFTRSDMGKPKSFKRKHPLANVWYGIGLGEPLTGTPTINPSCSVANATPVDVRSVQIADSDNTLIEFQAFGGDDGTLWTFTASATSAVDQSLLVVDVLLPVERHFG